MKRPAHIPNEDGIANQPSDATAVECIIFNESGSHFTMLERWPDIPECPWWRINCATLLHIKNMRVCWSRPQYIGSFHNIHPLIVELAIAGCKWLPALIGYKHSTQTYMYNSGLPGDNTAIFVVYTVHTVNIQWHTCIRCCSLV